MTDIKEKLFGYLVSGTIETSKITRIIPESEYDYLIIEFIRSFNEDKTDFVIDNEKITFKPFLPTFNKARLEVTLSSFGNEVKAMRLYEEEDDEDSDFDWEDKGSKKAWDEDDDLGVFDWSDKGSEEPVEDKGDCDSANDGDLDTDNDPFADDFDEEDEEILDFANDEKYNKEDKGDLDFDDDDDDDWDDDDDLEDTTSNESEQKFDFAFDFDDDDDDLEDITSNESEQKFDVSALIEDEDFGISDESDNIKEDKGDFDLDFDFDAKEKDTEPIKDLTPFDTSWIDEDDTPIEEDVLRMKLKPYHGKYIKVIGTLTEKRGQNQWLLTNVYKCDGDKEFLTDHAWFNIGDSPSSFRMFNYIREQSIANDAKNHNHYWGCAKDKCNPKYVSVTKKKLDTTYPHRIIIEARVKTYRGSDGKTKFGLGVLKKEKVYFVENCENITWDGELKVSVTSNPFK